MSSYGFNYYPKNWHANGYGWVNMQALAYATGEKTTPDGPGSNPSVGSSLYPSLPGSAALSYGFSDSVLNPQKPTSSLYPKLGFTDDSELSSPPREDNVRARPQELLCTAVHVPPDQNSYWYSQYLGVTATLDNVLQFVEKKDIMEENV
ncbi:unnamed protein product [Hermetia illucens]|uniref:Uncharacterized protein n=1 Tax=Hermetia illucens TaxID=343691 RepID=A0A7R8UZ35_HERIL|nr:uncharacterized protein LOC119656021 [Hermetia illucens]CAD7089219.1 unnamed protein product [Hermetia illucens]